MAGTHFGAKVDSAVSQALANVGLCHLGGVRDCYSSFMDGEQYESSHLQARAVSFALDSAGQALH